MYKNIFKFTPSQNNWLFHHTIYSLCILISSPRIPHYVNLIGSTHTQQMLLFVRVYIEIIIIYQTQMYIMTILKSNYKMYMKTCVAPFKNIFTTYLMWRSHINDNQFDVCTAITCGLFYLWTARVAFIWCNKCNII